MKILFLCVENSARSQMAEGIARKIFGNSADIQSAGSNPGRVHPLAIEVMKEQGIDISRQWSKSIDNINTADIDWVITLCAEEVCPFLSGNVQKQHWPFPNPTNNASSMEEQLKRFRSIMEEQLKRFRSIRDQLTQKILEFEKNNTCRKRIINT